MSESLPKGLSFQASTGQWKAQHKGQKITFNTARYGDMAKELANRALERTQTGTFDPVADDLLFKQSWKIDDAARQLGFSLTQLRQWMLTGAVNGKESRPPKRDVRGVDRITGHELMMALGCVLKVMKI
ncbi:hypothetical protein [Aeromonas caviae]|uniref:hypothetical protein n=1 Tax=Aeromonas caviae TaxID=648 RepID=UPI0030DB1FC8